VKTNKREFCQLVATGLYSSVTAVELVWRDDDKVDAEVKAKDLMKDKKILKLIERLRGDITLLASPTKEWVRYKLMSVIDDATRLNDFASIRYCLDQINKIDGNYDLSASGVDGVNLKMEF